MALSILDGNQSATTLSTILSSGQHITAHTVISLGTQAITDIVNATSANLTNTQLRASAVTVGGTVTVGNSLTISSLPAISGTVTANLGTFQVKNYNNVITSGYFRQAYDDSLAVSGMGDDGAVLSQIISVFGVNLSQATGSLPISGTVTIGSALPAGTNSIGVVTIGAGTVTIGAGTAQIGSVTASISGTVPVSGTFFQATQPASLASLPALAAGTAQIGSVTASISGTVPVSISSVTVGNSVTIGSLPAISGTVSIGNLGDGITTFWSDNAVNDISNAVNIGIVNYISDNNALSISGTVTANTFAVQGTVVNTSNFTSTTASTVLANYDATRGVLTIFNEGAGNLHICAGETCTTIAYQVRLSAGDYYKVPNHQTTITHSAVFATAGTARVCEVSQE